MEVALKPNPSSLNEPGIGVVGVSFRTVPDDAARSRYAVAAADIPGALESLRAVAGIAEVVLLSTCNRTEAVYGASEGHPDPADAVRRWFAARSGFDLGRVASETCALTNADAVRHLFRVVSGLDSLVPGETGIVNQAREAYAMAQKTQCTSRNLNKLFQRAFSVNKDLRTRTVLQQGQSSVASVAASLVHTTCGDVRNLTALVLGAGETAEDIARGLRRHGMGRLLVANRSLERGQALASKVDATCIPLAAIGGHLAECDIVAAATGSPTPLLHREDLARAFGPSTPRPLLLLDLSVPANIAPECAGFPGVTLRGIRDIQATIQGTLDMRRRQLVICEDLVDVHVSDFLSGLHARRAGRNGAAPASTA